MAFQIFKSAIERNNYNLWKFICNSMRANFTVNCECERKIKNKKGKTTFANILYVLEVLVAAVKQWDNMKVLKYEGRNKPSTSH